MAYRERTSTKKFRCLTVDVGMDMAVWLLARRTVPTIAEIRTVWDCSRAQAYRYRRSMADFLDRHGSAA